MRRPRKLKISAGDIVDALGVADDEAHLALDAVKAVRLTQREKRRVEIRAQWMQATVDALLVALKRESSSRRPSGHRAL